MHSISAAVQPQAETQKNSQVQVDKRVSAGRITWTGPLLIVVARTFLLVLGQASVATVFRLRHHPSPWLAAGPWWTVFGTMADVGCLLLLLRFTRTEGIRIRDLIGTIRLRHGRDLFVGLGYYFLIFPVHLASFVGSSWLIYRAWTPHIPFGQLEGRTLPLWAMIYSLSLWWIVWSATEETTYQAYVLPRLQALCRSPWISMPIVVFWWSLQHSALPLIPDWRYIVWRWLAFVPGVFLTAFIYHRKRRLAPMIVAHWPMDVVATALTLHY